MTIGKKSEECQSCLAGVPAQSAERKEPGTSVPGLNAESREQIAAIEEQIAAIEEQIAALEEQIAELRAESRTQSAERRVENENISAPVLRPNNSGTLNSALPPPLPRAKLATPVVEHLTAIGSRHLRVSWTAVPNATGYLVRWATDAGFVNNNASKKVASDITSTTISELSPETTYYVRIQAIAGSGDTDSDFSVVKSAATGIATDAETVMLLESLLAGQQTLFRDFAALLPQLDNTVLTPADRRRLNGSGVRRYGYADKVSDVAADYPQFWFLSDDRQLALKERLREIETLRNLLVWANFVARVVQDLLLVAGDDAFRMANMYYANVRTAVRNNLPEARQVFEMLNLFWQRRRNPAAEPTIPEVERDVRALLRGTKEGEVVVKRTGDFSPRTKGEKVIIDETMPRPRGGVKVIERGEAE